MSCSMTNMLTRRAFVPALLSGLLGLFSGTSLAKPAGDATFDGIWSGAGTVALFGRPEPISCRVRNTNRSGGEYFSSFTCAMDAYGSGSLTIPMERVGARRYSGRFYDSFNQVNVQVSVLQEGNSQKVLVSSKKWKGVLHLRK